MLNYKNKYIKFIILSSLLFILWIPSSWANSQEKVYIAIIIDDLGYKYKQDSRAVNLPSQVTLSFLPFTPHADSLIKVAHSQGHDIMLHLPMQALMETLYLGPGALTSNMTEWEFKQSVKKSIGSIPHVKGINNHMGSLMTSKPKAMKWLMEELVKTNLYFVDSRTTIETVAEKTANDFSINNTRRNIFLDHEINRPAIDFQFKQLIKMAKKYGSAVAIGHPHGATLSVLEKRLPQLKAQGIELVPVSQLIKQQYLAKTKQTSRNITHNYKSVKEKPQSKPL